ncbi:MAG: baseplate wedge protein 53 [Methanobacterium sp.]
MAYFNELPNLEVVSRFPNQSTNQDYVTIKNLWRRAKLREDIANAITAFNYYQIEGNERPDQIAEKVYGDPELDWIILITNNITNLNKEWPLDNESFYNYLIDKYGSEEALQEIHHTETVEPRDIYNRLLIPGGLIVDDAFKTPTSFNTTPGQEVYELDGFPSTEELRRVTINLIQALNVKQRDFGDVLYLIPDIFIETSQLKVYPRNNNVMNVTINNNLAENWPSSWGGTLSVVGRDSNIQIEIDDTLSSIYRINIPERLYVIQVGPTGPIFIFQYNPTA